MYVLKTRDVFNLTFFFWITKHCQLVTEKILKSPQQKREKSNEQWLLCNLFGVLFQGFCIISVMRNGNWGLDARARGIWTAKYLICTKKIAKLESREWTRMENSSKCIEELINGATTEYPATLVRLTYMCREAFKRHNTINVILIQWHINEWQGILQLSR